jgi:hypothetical protein
MTNIVPFGKYKNQPIEALAEDKNYCEWLAGQGWLAEKFPAIHTLIINNFAEPDETPEHNRLQLRFLDNGFRLRCSVAMLEAIYGAGQIWCCDIPDEDPQAPQFEINGIDVFWTTECSRARSATGKRFEENLYPRLSIECKPSLGDDYPAVLRKLQSYRIPFGVERLCPEFRAVVIENFTALGGTFEQVKHVFKNSRVLLITAKEIEAYPLPAWDEERFG